MADEQRTYKEATHFSDLSPELIFDILSRLHVTFLLQSVKYTCKLFYSIVDDPAFVNLHAERALNNPPGLLYSHWSENTTALYFADDPSTAIKLPGHLGDIYNFTFFASSRGLMTYKVIRDHSIYVCNPLTCDRVRLPVSGLELSRYELRFGFGYAPRTDKYKYIECFKLSISTSPLHAFVVTLGESSWRQLAVPPHDIDRMESDGIYCNGALYWLWYVKHLSAGSERNVISFDLDTEKFRFRRVLPNDVEYVGSISQYLTTLWETMAFVVLTEDYIQDVWMLVDEAMDIWEVKYRIRLPKGLNTSFKLSALSGNGDFYGIEHEWPLSKVIKSYDKSCQTCFTGKLPVPDDMDDNENYSNYEIIVTHVGCLISPSRIVATTTNQPFLVTR